MFALKTDGTMCDTHTKHKTILRFFFFGLGKTEFTAVKCSIHRSDTAQLVALVPTHQKKRKNTLQQQFEASINKKGFAKSLLVFKANMSRIIVICTSFDDFYQAHRSGQSISLSAPEMQKST